MTVLYRKTEGVEIRNLMPVWNIVTEIVFSALDRAQFQFVFIRGIYPVPVASFSFEYPQFNTLAFSIVLDAFYQSAQKIDPGFLKLSKL